MKILELRFKNLNSLYGEWLIDFTDPHYVSNGIFALTGPTGAGKSTILDAICLALYGMTPRLGKITKSGNEIMSRQTGECYAEVLFESRAGRFRCHWEQRRARKSPEGNLQDQEHQVADGDTGTLIETKKSLVAGVIEEKTGMDFDRFTRSILLAQGGFDTFLKADAEQKSKILEQITGTEVYSEISIAVHERKREEQEKLNLLNAETAGIAILDREQEEKILAEQEETEKREADLTGKSAETVKAVAWLTTIESLKGELKSLTEEEAKGQKEREAFASERIKLERAVKAASLESDYAVLTSLRKEQAEDRTALKTAENALPDREASAKALADSLKTAELFTLESKEKRNRAVPLIRKIRSLDQRIADQERTVSESSAVCAGEAAEIESNKGLLSKEKEKQTDAERVETVIDRYLKENCQDEWLVGGLAGIEEQFAGLLGKKGEIQQKEADFRKGERAEAEASKALEESSARCTLRKKEVEKAVEDLQAGKTALKELLGDKLLREYRSEKETLLREMVYIKRIQALEDQRAGLEDGIPCPLCGSKEHPYALGNIPEPDEIEREITSLSGTIAGAEELEEANGKKEQAVNSAREKLNESEKEESRAVHEKSAAEKNLLEIKDNLRKLRGDFDELKRTVTDKLNPLGIGEIPESELSSLLEKLKERLGIWLERIHQKSEIERKKSVCESEIKRLAAIIETRSKALTENRESLERLRKEWAEGSEERRALYGDKNPDEEEEGLNKAIADGEEAEKKARERNGEGQQKLTAEKSRIESLQVRIARREPDLKRREEAFLTALVPAGFTGEEPFLDARLSPDVREALSARAGEIDNSQTELMARRKDRETRLLLERERKLTDRTLEELEPQLKLYEEALKELRESLAALKHRLRENRAARERIREKQTAIEAQKRECARWEKLHGLIGSADGKKYRTFAQGLTFELMVSHANRQLRKMTDRYLLIRDEEEPLELNVIDTYQAGEIRSTKNLSGGESFIISLTLALGLSSMASRKVRVDSLFLDEGFGTLDEESLETALETLAGLQQDGKLIGIISHVAALKERIGTRISISPLSGGKSSLAGPGCRSVS